MAFRRQQPEKYKTAKDTAQRSSDWLKGEGGEQDAFWSSSSFNLYCCTSSCLCQGLVNAHITPHAMHPTMAKICHLCASPSPRLPPLLHSLSSSSSPARSPCDTSVFWEGESLVKILITYIFILHGTTSARLVRGSDPFMEKKWRSSMTSSFFLLFFIIIAQRGVFSQRTELLHVKKFSW